MSAVTSLIIIVAIAVAIYLVIRFSGLKDDSTVNDTPSAKVNAKVNESIPDDTQ